MSLGGIAAHHLGALAMDFPITGLLDQDACYHKLVDLIHPDGLACPRCHARDGLKVHRRDRDPILDYRCTACRRVFNAWTGTPLQGMQRRPAQILLILRGFAQGTSTARLARELGRDRMKLLELRHRLQGNAALGLDRNPLGGRGGRGRRDDQNAGEKKESSR